MKKILVLAALAYGSGCGVSSSTLDEEMAKAKGEWEAYAKAEAENQAKEVQGAVMKRVVDVESNFATRTAMEEAIRKSQVKTLDECDKKLAVLEGQVEEMKKKVDVANMANKEELLRILDGLRAITVTMVQQLRKQQEAIDASIKQLEAFNVPELPPDGDKPK